jgi:sugar phosphate isomerase/epimerase
MNQSHNASIYLGTVLLESNRWIGDRIPACRVSEWIERISAAGFDGIELWENHFVMADAAERAALRAAQLPVTILNSYASMGADGAKARQQASGCVRELGAKAVKFNAGANPDSLEDELLAARAWAGGMPGVSLFCECHAGTILEDPAVAATALANYPEIGVIVHPFSCPDLAEWLHHFGPRVRHAHVQVLDAQKRRCRLRDQQAKVKERLARMRDSGFAGSYTIEFTAGVGATPEDPDALFASACDDLMFLRDALKGGLA